MIEWIWGLCLLLIPFCLVFCFRNKIFGFAVVFTAMAAAHLLIALGLQSAGIFSYATVMACNIALVGFALAICVRYGPSFSEFTASLRRLQKINWFAIAAFVIVFYELFSVHYLYTGIIVANDGEQSVSHAAYQYPYFSDEYAGIAFASYSIRSHSLPLANPLYGDRPFANVLVGFFSVIAELFVLTGMNPLTGYVPFAIAEGLAVCLFIYLFLRSRNVDSFSASCAVLFVPLIVNGSNLPGIWSLLPFIAGFILFAAGLVIMSDFEGETEAASPVLSLCAFYISLIFYPPMIVFVAPVLIFMCFDRRIIRNRRLLWIVAGSVLAAAAVALIAMALSGTFSLVFRNNLVEGIPSFPVWVVLPWFVLPFSALGAYACLKNKMHAFIVPVAVGIVYWIAYAYTTRVFIIDYPRIVVITSFMLVLLAGFGIGFLIKKTPPPALKRWLLPLRLGVCAVFVFGAISYPPDTWGELTLSLSAPAASGESLVALPASPVTHYLTADDLRLFSGITGRTFIAPPWKGLVIGAATHNYPLDSKASTLTVFLYPYQQFMSLDCAAKDSVARKFSLQYAYTPPFSCGDFILMGSSTEGLYLYEFTGYNETTYGS